MPRGADDHGAGTGLQVVTAFDNAGNSSTSSFEIEHDTTPPAGGSITAPNIMTNLPTQPIGLTLATDGQSQLGTTQIFRSSTSYLNGTCEPTTWTVFAPVGPVNPGTSWTDPALLNATCYDYQVRFTDNVGNFAIRDSASVLRIDRIEGDVGFENVTVCAGADAVVGFTCLATVDPGDEVVTAWPSFPSYVLDPLKLGGVPVRINDPQCVAKTFPEYFAVFRSIAS